MWLEKRVGTGGLPTWFRTSVQSQLGMLGHRCILPAASLLLFIGGCREPTLIPAHTPTPTSPLTPIVDVEPFPCVKQYGSPGLGFALQHRCGWDVSCLVHGPCTDDPNRLCDAVLFQTSDDFGNSYGVTVFRYWPAMGETVTDTVEYGLRTLAARSRQQIKTRCCPTVDGEPAMELIFPRLPADRFRDRQLSVVHNGGEYALIFWWSVPFQPAGVFDIPEGSAVEATFDTVLRSFTFIPIVETPTPPPPVPTAVPTPTWTPTPTRSLSPRNTQSDLWRAVQSA